MTIGRTSARIGFLILGLLSFTVGAEAKVVYVAKSGSDVNDGLSWTTAKLTVQAGLNAAVSGDELWVAAGTYVECVTLPDGVALYGGFVSGETDLSQRNWTTNPTILDGNASAAVVTTSANATSTTRIDGFTIRNGNATKGAGIATGFSSPTVANNTITGNAGLGIYCCRSIIANNIISNNTSSGVYCGSASITNNTITENTSCGILCGGTPTITNNRITGNAGGGIHCNCASPTIANNAISGNSATYGAGIQCNNASPMIVNNTIIGNSSRGGAGVYCCDDSSPTIVNTIVAFNSSGILQAGSGILNLRSNCVYGNGIYNYSGLNDPTGTNGNISVDPRLAGAFSRNPHLECDSPCMDTGVDTMVPTDWEDIDGQARIIGFHVDIGSDESDGTIWPEEPDVIVRVSPEGNDANDGSSWPSAKRTVQAAIDAAVPGGDVWVRAGTYPERITLRPFIHVYGGFNGTETQRRQRDWHSNASILDGQSGGSVVMASGSGCAVSIINGFTIRNGNAVRGGGVCCESFSPMIANNTVTENTGYGVYCSDSASPMIIDNTITANSRSGIYCDSSSPAITGNTITSNKGNGCGGGIYCNFSSPTITNNTIMGHDLSGCGGGVFCYSSSPVISGNRITGNTALNLGGAIACAGSSFSTITNNTIAANRGGGVYCSDSSPTITNNMICGNWSVRGGGIYCFGSSSPSITNNTITGNDAQDGGAIYYSSSPTITNTIIAFNSSGVRGGDAAILRSNCVYGNTAYDYSVVANPTGTDGSISVDPGFIRPPSPGADGQWATADDDAGNLHLKIGSPCIDAGNNSTVPEGILTDLEGRLRFFNDATALDSGVGTAPIIDMGAYESVRPVPGDLDHDRDIDDNDLKAFLPCLRGQGLSYSADCAVVDFDEDGDVDLSDFGLMQRCFSGVGQPVNPDCGV